MGTASDVGKSVVVTALCRAFARAGVRVAPFKSQNMSNNAAVCPGGGEIGRAQAVQAEACGIEPSPDMNPVLLKTQSDMRCQVVIRGRARFQMGVNDYERYRTEAWPEIVSSYSNLARNFDLIVIEGAGGAAEINLRASRHRQLENRRAGRRARADRRGYRQGRRLCLDRRHDRAARAGGTPSRQGRPDQQVPRRFEAARVWPSLSRSSAPASRYWECCHGSSTWDCRKKTPPCWPGSRGLRPTSH